MCSTNSDIAKQRKLLSKKAIEREMRYAIERVWEREWVRNTPLFNHDK